MPQLLKDPFLLSVHLLSTHTFFGVFFVNLYWFVYWFEKRIFKARILKILTSNSCKNGIRALLNIRKRFLGV